MKCHINREIYIGIPNNTRRQKATCGYRSSKRKARSDDVDKHVLLEMKGSEIGDRFPEMNLLRRVDGVGVEFGVLWEKYTQEKDKGYLD